MRRAFTASVAAVMAAVMFSWPGINAAFAAEGGAIAALRIGTTTITLADMEGTPIEGTPVRITDPGGAEVFAGTSGKKGVFKVPELAPGPYTLSVDGKYSFLFRVVEEGGDKALWVVVPREGLAAIVPPEGGFVRVGSNVLWVGLGAAAVVIPIVLIGSSDTDCK